MAVVVAELKLSGSQVTPAVAAASATFWTRAISTYHRATSTEMAHNGSTIVAVRTATRMAAYPDSLRARRRDGVPTGAVLTGGSRMRTSWRATARTASSVGPA